MNQSASQQQAERIAAYRRRRTPDSQSDSQARPWGDVTGAARPLGGQPPPPAPNYGAAIGRPFTNPGYPALPQQPTQPPSGAFAAAMRAGTGAPEGMVASPGPSTYRPPPAPAAPSAAIAAPLVRPTTGLMQGAGSNNDPRSGSIPPSQHDLDIRSYIFDLELQNRELRKQLEIATMDSMPASAAIALGSDEAKRDFLTNVLVQVEGIVEAHRNKANADIQKYKAEADQAKLALEQLREVIQTEGLDLTLAPAMISFHKRQQRAHEEGKGVAPSPLGINLPPEVNDMLHQVAVDVLTKLQTVKDRDDLGSTMREAIRSGFQSIVVHFTDEVLNATKKQEVVIATLKSELDAARQDVRTVTLAHEGKRVELATQHALEMDAMKDQLRILTANLGSGHDQLSHAMHEKAFAEYAQLLIESRKEATDLRNELDVEKTKSAEVCLKLKATLERKREEFEKDLVAKAEEVVAQRDRTIIELEARLQRREAEFAARYAERREFGAQAGEPLITLPSKEDFGPQIVSGLHKQSRAAAQSNEFFERDVWRKTQELLSKYGPGAPNPHQQGAPAARGFTAA